MNWALSLIITVVLLAVQGPPRPVLVRAGTLAGRVLSSTGEPASGVRVAALEVPDAGSEASTPSMMAGLARTDEMGRYRLENVPPGRYRVVAGEVERLQYHPEIVTVTAGITTDNLDFTLSNAFGTIEARVHLTGSQQPIPNAVVNVRSSTGHLRSAVADEKGVATMSGVEYGTYTVSTPTISITSAVRNVERDPARAPGEIRVEIVVDEARPEWEVSLGILRPATLQGVVRDPNGAPVQGARVTSLSVGHRIGRRSLLVEASTTTDADGRYQMLSGFGERYIRVDPPAIAMTQGEAVTFAPSAGEPGKAGAVLVENAETLENLDVVIGRTFKVSGRVTNLQQGMTIPSVVFVSNSNVDYALTFSNMAPSSDGEFAVAGVPSGSWTVFPLIAGTAAPATLGSNRAAKGAVDIAGDDVEGVVATLATIDIAGRIVVEGGGDPGLPSIYLASREHVPQPAGQGSYLGSVAADGSFQFEDVPPLRYGIQQVSGLSPGLYVADIRAAGASVFNDGIVSGDSQPATDVEIVIARGASRLQGTVSLPPNTRVNDARVVLVPDAPRRANPLLYRTAVIREDGGFTMFPDVAPGTYKVFAVTYLPAGGAEMDSAFLERHEQSAVPVTISPNQTTTLTLEIGK